MSFKLPIGLYRDLAVGVAEGAETRATGSCTA